MKQFFLIIFLLSVMVFPCRLVRAENISSTESTVHPERLRCEYLINPLGLDIVQPRLDWILSAGKKAPRNLMQSAYQILVASSPEILARNQGDLWDTGKVSSSGTAHIVYEGKTLASRQACFWKVRSWDSSGKVTKWSEASSWEMGLLQPGDWQAKWIEGHPTTDPAHQYGPLPILRRDFSVAGSPVLKARLYVTALGLYEMRLNGQRVGDHIFAPDWTDYNKRVRYQVYDVTSLLKAGDNTVAGMLGNGWYSGHIGNGGFQAWGKVPALYAQLEITHTDGAVEVIGSDSKWKTQAGPILASDFMIGESYDARKEIPRWDLPGADLSSWSAANERQEAPRAFDGQVIQPVRQLAELAPKSVTEPQPGHYVYDFGQNMVGFVRLKIRAAAGTEVVLRHAEVLEGNGTLYTTNLRSATSVDTYICSGQGQETWQPRFTFHGFRYLEVTGLEKAPDLDSVRGIVVGTDLPWTGTFSSSSLPVNQLQSNIQWGMRGNYLSVPTDCPQRDERMGWLGDAQVFVKTAAYNADIAAFYTKWLVDVDDAQNADGSFTSVAPMPEKNPYGPIGAPGWGDAGVICPWTIYLMYGDVRLLRQHLPAMTRWVEWGRVHSKDFIRDRDRGHDYGDWLSQGENTSKELIGTAYFAYSTSLVAKSYRALGDPASAQKYEQLFEEIRKAFQQRYVDAEGHVQGGTQTGYALALQFNLLPENLRAKATQYLEENVKGRGDHLATGFVGVSYLLPALTADGKNGVAYRLLLQDTFPSWLFSVKNGATTIWERWDGWRPEKGFQDPGMNSFNHYSLGSCGEWLFDSVAGIGLDPAEPGFGKIVIRPQPGEGLTQASGSFDSIHGKISTDWKVEKGEFVLRLSIPVNVTATVYLPSGDKDSVTEGGRPIAAAPDIKIASNEHGETGFQVGSGSYSFRCRYPK